MLLHEGEEAIEREDANRATDVGAVDEPVHQAPRLGHVRQDLPVQHDQRALALVLADGQREDSEPAVLERAAVGDERQQRREGLLALLRVERLDDVGFGLGLGLGRIKDARRAVAGALVLCLALL